MAEMRITVDIPALERLCAILEVHVLHEERKLDLAEKAADIAAPIVAAPKASPESQKRPAEAPKAEAANPASEPEKPKADPAPGATEAAPVTLDALQRAAAQMRDEGKLKAVTDMFPEFGIKKLSDLMGDALQAFGERLRGMGAKV